ncbi:MAG: NUDIX domain-containing protein [Candidatus Doudnabacteria bacterium]|nr:NUDIX domain-containing protein [Candidatus Doudnabacteria bacterium]
MHTANRENSTFIDKLAWVFVKDKKVLSTKSRGKDTWYIPGGKREGGESDEQALTREIKEELNVALSPATIRYLGTFEAQAHGKAQGVKVRMTCYSADYSGRLKPRGEIAGLTFLDYQGRNQSSPVDKLIFDYLKQKDLIN